MSPPPPAISTVIPINRILYFIKHMEYFKYKKTCNINIIFIYKKNCPWNPKVGIFVHIQGRKRKGQCYTLQRNLRVCILIGLVKMGLLMFKILPMLIEYSIMWMRRNTVEMAGGDIYWTHFCFVFRLPEQWWKLSTPNTSHYMSGKATGLPSIYTRPHSSSSKILAISE